VTEGRKAVNFSEWGGYSPGARRALLAFFSSDVPDDELLGYWQRMQDESYRALLDMVALDLPKPSKVRTPMLVLGAARDNMLAPREIEATARAYNTRCEIVPDVAHDSMLERHWDDVAERILAWLNERAA
jgi:alpha-beta hydrolase superfamily lysophospholipase